MIGDIGTNGEPNVIVAVFFVVAAVLLGVLAVAVYDAVAAVNYAAAADVVAYAAVAIETVAI